MANGAPREVCQRVCQRKIPRGAFNILLRDSIEKLLTHVLGCLPG